MSYLYYPGCSAATTGKAYEKSLLAVFKALDISMDELDDWNCCGATSYMAIDETKAFALAARNLALAEHQSEGSNGHSHEIVAPCSACFLVLSKTKQYLHDYPDVRTKIVGALNTAGLEYKGTATVRHPLDIIVNDIGLAKIEKRVQHKLKGVKVACYYGCQIVRPFKTFDHPFYPTSMDRLVKALGAEPVEWPLKTRCCGGTLTGTIPEAGLRLNRALIKDAVKRNADLMLTCCPLCQFNLECYQDKISAEYHEPIHMPIAYFTQLIGIAFGLSEKELGMSLLFQPPSISALKAKGGPVHV
jgi:heterodisulfide reductase subunit B